MPRRSSRSLSFNVGFRYEFYNTVVPYYVIHSFNKIFVSSPILLNISSLITLFYLEYSSVATFQVAPSSFPFSFNYTCLVCVVHTPGAEVHRTSRLSRSVYTHISRLPIEILVFVKYWICVYIITEARHKLRKEFKVQRNNT